MNFPIFKHGLAAVLVLISSWPLHAIETARIDDSTGAPRILIDGKPVRARIFFGNAGRAPLTIGPEAQQISFDFTALGTAADGTMHFRFGQQPGEVYLGNIHVVDLDTQQDVIPLSNFEGGMDAINRDWTHWPQGAQDTVGTIGAAPGAGPDGSTALHITLQNPPSGAWPDFHLYHNTNLSFVKGHHYHVSFWVRSDANRSLTVAFYQPGNPFIFLGGTDVFTSQIKMAAAAGAPFVSFGLDAPWPPPGTPPDWGGIDGAFEQILAANPNALIIPRVTVWPPKWWIQAHPDDIMVWDGYDPANDTNPGNAASPLYRHDAAEALTALITHCEEKYGSHIAGYHVAGQSSAEWFYCGTWAKPLNGYAKADLIAWQKWLQARYSSDEALQAAWHQPGATLASAQVPTPEARRAAPAGVFRDPATEQPIIDFTEFQQQMMADCICELAHAARQASHGRKLVLFFYGYVFEFAYVQNGPGISGHYALRQVLQSPDIDILCSPLSYTDRGLDGSAPIMTPAESIALAGKMYLVEDDTSTYLAMGSFAGVDQGLKTVEDSRQTLLRNTAECALRNFATWWMDLGGNGWFNDPRLWQEMARLNALDQPLLDHPTPYCPEVAAVIDPDSMMRVASWGSNVTGPGVSAARVALGRLGAPYGQYLLDDVIAGRVKAKLYVFLAAWHLSPEQRQKLLAATRGSTCIWCYAPGYQEGDHTSLDAMRELTGFTLKMISGVNAWAEPTALGSQSSLPPFGLKQTVEPLFAATDAGTDESLAAYSDGSTAVAVRTTNMGTSIFTGPPGLTPGLLRFAARLAKVHLYTQTDCTVFANGPYLVLHSLREGPLQIDTGRSSPIHDVLTGETLGNGPQLSLPLKNGETRVLEIGQVQ
ncbi:MAG: beta-galactosidase [Methylacidiphilales bacterium]|nr:beta-galactosidase [Candidatus Methylacidiphilales bacterium]